MEALKSSDYIVGYTKYVELIKPLFPEKSYIAKGMRQELDRCRIAVRLARDGNRVAVISSGDVGIYGMAGALFDYCRIENVPIASPEGVKGEELIIEVIPGVSALNAAASILGAPLGHDFAVISLSDHLTPWQTIKTRLDAAAKADFVIVIFNPRSKSRPYILKKAIHVIEKHLEPTRPVGIVKRATRQGQERIITSISAIPYIEVDMQTIIIIGNRSTYVWNNWMITPRGYEEKYYGVDARETL